MKIIVPMAGIGKRFVDKGYSKPKPLIQVGRKPIVQYIIDMFSVSDDFIFICNEKHLELHDFLKKYVNNCTIITIPEHKKGPCYTVKFAYNFINNDEPVIVTYCDNPYIWNYSDFKQYVKNNNLDGCILSHTGFHPHTLAKTKMAFMKENNELVTEVQEKKSYTDTPQLEHASTGTYYFKKGEYIKRYFDLLMDKNINYNGEYYVTLVYNLLIEDKLKVGYYDTPYVTVFGTPEEVEQFEAWKTIINGEQIKTVEDLINTYNYWKNYDKNISSWKYRL